ncbi:MAG: PQQ-like beta-propeller repeat protein, partial [Sedimentisphaerales bacterium]|nr:PQQ-like beta-propeller repeat protein [Sedimentisphaerales bacterium]
MLNMTKAVLLALTVFSTLLYAVDYPQWRGEGRRGVFSETNLIDTVPADGPSLKWMAQGIGDGYSSVIAVGEMIYTTGMKNKTATISAIDRNTGNVIWQKPYGTSWTEKQYAGERTTPTYDDGKVYVFGPHGQLHCFNATDGNQFWAVDTFATYGGRNITWGVSESVVVEGDMVICTPGGENASLVALNKNTGELIWKSPISDKSAYCSAVVVDYAGLRMLVTMLDKNIYGINAANGKVLWQVAHKVAYDINAVTPIIDKDIIYVSNGYKLGGKAFKIAPDASSVTELWQDKRLDCQLGGLSYAD